MSKNPGANYRQEQMDAVSGREDMRHRADKRVDKTKRREQIFKENLNAWHNNVKALVDNTWQISPLCHLLWWSLVLNGTYEQHAIVLKREDANTKEETLKVLTVSSRSLR